MHASHHLRSGSPSNMFPRAPLLICLLMVASHALADHHDAGGEEVEKRPDCLTKKAVEYITKCTFDAVEQVEKYFGKEYSKIDDDIGEQPLQCILWDLKAICFENRNRAMCGEEYAKEQRQEMDKARPSVVNVDCSSHMEKILRQEEDSDFRHMVTVL